MDHPFGFWSLAPPLVAVTLAIITRRIVLSLLVGVLVGAVLAAQPTSLAQAVAAVVGAAEVHLWPSLIDEDHLRVFAFTLLMGAMVGVVQRAGGLRAMVAALAPWAHSRRGGQLLTWLLGLLIFFDDYANSLLLGSAMRPLTDRLRISREKLAYLVDSTAAPVAGLALVSTWVAGEIGYIAAGLQTIDFADSRPPDAFGLFIASIPYRFYVLWSLALVALVGLLNRDFGPMLAAERRAARLAGDDANAVTGGVPTVGRAWPPGTWLTAAVPVLLVIAATLALLYATGAAAVAAEDLEPSWMNLIGNSDSYLSLVYGSLAGWLAAVALGRRVGRLRWSAVRRSSLAGAQQMLPALGVLWMAWTLATLTGPSTYDAVRLDAGGYLGGVLEHAVAPVWMPALVFVLAGATAFCTGTSWGTMGLLMPLAIQATHRMLAASGPVDPYDPILVSAIGSVLAGAIFGDHCSPLSDTTVLSAQASRCDLLAHVVTQMPYALVVAALAVGLGLVPAAWGVSPWLLLACGVGALAALLWAVGRPPTAD